MRNWWRRSGSEILNGICPLTWHKMERFLNIDTFRHINENAPYTTLRWSWLLKHVFWSHANCLLKNVSLKYQTLFSGNINSAYLRNTYCTNNTSSSLTNDRVLRGTNLNGGYKHAHTASLCEELWNVSVTKPRCFISECRINKRYIWCASAAYRGVLLTLLIWFCSRPT